MGCGRGHDRLGTPNPHIAEWASDRAALKGDLGIQEGKAVTSDILALIDFYVDNGIVEEGEDGKEKFPVSAAQLGLDMKVRRLLMRGSAPGWRAEIVAALGVPLLGYRGTLA